MMAAMKFSFFDISTPDGGDFPRIIEIVLLFFILELNKHLRCIVLQSFHESKSLAFDCFKWPIAICSLMSDLHSYSLYQFFKEDCA